MTKNPKPKTKNQKLKQSWREKLADAKDLPKVVHFTDNQSLRWGPGPLAIPAPMEVAEIMQQVPPGKLITIKEIRQVLASKHGAGISCPMVTGLFVIIAANAAEEEAAEGGEADIPYWRTLKSGGELNPKYPGGLTAQQQHLEAEGHLVIPKGKRLVVAGYERVLVGTAD